MDNIQKILLEKNLDINLLKQPQFKLNEEVIGEGKRLDGKKLSEVQVQDWLFDFDVSKKDFPVYQPISKNLSGEVPLSIFVGNLVQQYVRLSWQTIRDKRFLKQVLGNKERKIRRKIRGFFGSKDLIPRYKEEKSNFAKFLHELDTKILRGNFIYDNINQTSNDIVLSSRYKKTGKQYSKLVNDLRLMVKFGSSWERAIQYLLLNISSNEEILYIDNVPVIPAAITTNVKPNVLQILGFFKDAFNLDTDYVNFDETYDGIKYASKLIIEESLKIPSSSDSGKWSQCLNNTPLFYFYQKLMVIGATAYALDTIGDTDLLNNTYMNIIKSDSDELYGVSPNSGIEDKDINYTAVANRPAMSDIDFSSTPSFNEPGKLYEWAQKNLNVDLRGLSNSSLFHEGYTYYNISLKSEFGIKILTLLYSKKLITDNDVINLNRQIIRSRMYTDVLKTMILPMVGTDNEIRVEPMSANEKNSSFKTGQSKVKDIMMVREDMFKFLLAYLGQYPVDKVIKNQVSMLLNPTYNKDILTKNLRCLTMI